MEYSALGLQHAIVRAFLREHFNASHNTGSLYLFSFHSYIFLLIFPLLLYHALPIDFIPLPSAVLSYFLYSLFQHSSVSPAIMSSPLTFPYTPLCYHPAHLFSSSVFRLSNLSSPLFPKQFLLSSPCLTSPLVCAPCVFFCTMVFSPQFH